MHPASTTPSVAPPTSSSARSTARWAGSTAAATATRFARTAIQSKNKWPPRSLTACGRCPPRGPQAALGRPGAGLALGAGLRVRHRLADLVAALRRAALRHDLAGAVGHLGQPLRELLGCVGAQAGPRALGQPAVRPL